MRAGLGVNKVADGNVESDGATASLHVDLETLELIARRGDLSPMYASGSSCVGMNFG